MSEFSDLAQVVIDCVGQQQPLPLHVAIALADGRLEAMWRTTNDPGAMSYFLAAVRTPLPPGLVVPMAERAAEVLGAREAVNELIELHRHQCEEPHPGTGYCDLPRLIKGLWGVVDDSTLELKKRHAWRTLSAAMQTMRDVDQGQSVADIDSDVATTIWYAKDVSDKRKWLADLLRPLGPPSLEQILMAVAEGPRP
jgi:hypothetical protein